MGDNPGAIPDDPKALVEAMVKYARDRVGQPVAILVEDSILKAGILSYPDPEPEDWYKLPVPLEQFEYEPVPIKS